MTAQPAVFRAGWRGCSSVAEAVESLLSDGVFGDHGPWSYASVADFLDCSQQPVKEAMLGLFHSGHLTRTRQDGGYQQPGCWSYAWRR